MRRVASELAELAHGYGGAEEQTAAAARVEGFVYLVPLCLSAERTCRE